jgi:hypothetical protein
MNLTSLAMSLDEVPLPSSLPPVILTVFTRPDLLKEVWLFGLSYAMDGGYKGWNPYIERHLAIFVNCFSSRANSSIKSVAR